MEGILVIDKPKGATSFQLVRILRKILNVSKIGHAGTLDPMATGLMLLLVGKNFTRLSDQLMGSDKSYEAEITLGVATDSYDADGTITHASDYIPTLDEVKEAITHFQGEIAQIPPMFSAKKVKGQKLYDLARKGITIERKPALVRMKVDLVEYDFPLLKLKIDCSKGTYIRSISHELGLKLKTYATLSALKRTRSGKFNLEKSVDGSALFKPMTVQELSPFFIHALPE